MNNRDLLKIIESNLMSTLFKFQNELYQSGSGRLSQRDIEQIDKHWKLLKLVTEDIFDTAYKNDRSNIGNV